MPRCASVLPESRCSSLGPSRWLTESIDSCPNECEHLESRRPSGESVSTPSAITAIPSARPSKIIDSAICSAAHIFDDVVDERTVDLCSSIGKRFKYEAEESGAKVVGAWIIAKPRSSNPKNGSLLNRPPSQMSVDSKSINSLMCTILTSLSCSGGV